MSGVQGVYSVGYGMPYEEGHLLLTVAEEAAGLRESVKA